MIEEKDWESIELNDGGAIKLVRLKVFGGWLVSRTTSTGGLTFVPDKNHEWKV